ncbi:MAG: hypothetical protein ACRD1T_05450, partial [Acidimicrobiia bacterium]
MPDDYANGPAGGFTPDALAPTPFVANIAKGNTQREGNQLRSRFVKLIAAGVTVVAFAAAPAFGETQVVDATLGGALSMTGDPTAAVSGWVLNSSGTTTTSG